MTPHAAEKAVVLGGGVCGLRAALTFARAGVAVTVLEKEDEVGGLAASPRHGGNAYDYGVHMLHGFDEALRDDLVALMGEDAHAVPLDARICWRGKTFRYPLRLADLLTSLSPLELIQGAAGLCWAGLRERFAPSPEPQNAEEALRLLYGDALYRLFFESFTHRYWDRHPRELSATFIRTKMPRLSAIDAVRRLLRKAGLPIPAPKVESALEDEVLTYSRKGARALPEAMATEIRRLGGEVLTGVTPIALDWRDCRCVGVRFQQNGTAGEAVRALDYLVSTIPPASLVALAGKTVPSSARAGAQALRHRPLAVFGVLVKRERVLEGLYTYYRDHRFHRISEPKNAGLAVDPPGATVLLFEVMCSEGDIFWEGAEAAWKQLFDEVRGVRLFEESEVIDRYHRCASHGYPVFDRGFEPHYKAFSAWVDSPENLRSVGRQGAFSYPNMHSAMASGDAAAESLLAGRGAER